MMRLTERLSRLFVKLSLLMGRTVLASIKNIRDSIVDQFRSDRDPLSRAEAQVQRLSGVTVILLAAVVLLVLWATGAQASSSPVFNILDVGAPEQPAPLADQPLAPAAPVPQPAGVPLTNVGGTLLFAMDVGGQSDIFALEPGESEPVRLTADPADDRDPVWSPDGTRIAFSSRRDGNWELYTLNVIDGTVNRLTFDLVYEAAPSWSPDGEFLAYEAYYNGNLDVYIVRSDGSEAPYPLTVSPEPDFSPAWITTLPGREIAYVSGR
ncbi:MAG: hypothetical protein GYB64_04790, partial [Chloroflexi bacterium]|nr:hypothetical protein [Chloroflexota bacterium]